MYITPITKVHSNLDEAKKFYRDNAGLSLFGHDKLLGLAELTQADRNLIVGEPGVGKTRLLKEIEQYLIERGVRTERIGLRRDDAAVGIERIADAPPGGPSALLLDALDEVSARALPAVLRAIDEVSIKRPDLPIYLSSRWVFIDRYASSFPSYRFITISPFTRAQVSEFLSGEGRKKSEIEALFSRVMPFSHNMLVLQIPRYLIYLNEFLKKNDIASVTKLSRNDLFEYFIDSKLELEDKNLSAHKQSLVKRALEKLALTMEIYQTNAISKDELMTFFDDVRSDLTLAVLSQLETFFDKSLLRVGSENLDMVEFDNVEFQEYLAAKEITRFPDPRKAAFTFAADPDINEIYPTWFNALTFLVDMRPDLLEQLIEFSGVRGGKSTIVDEGFLLFLSRVDPRNVPRKLKADLFISLVAYHQRELQWMPSQLASALPDFFISDQELTLKEWVSEAERKSDEHRFVPLGNIAYVVAYLFRHGVALDIDYWKPRLITYTSDGNENGVLQRHALFALSQLGDPTVVSELPAAFMDSQDTLFVGEFLSLCKELDPDSKESLGYFFQDIQRGGFNGRYGLYGVKGKEALKAFLGKLGEDESFRRAFLDKASTSGQEDRVIVEHIDSVWDGEIAELSKQAVVTSLDFRSFVDAERSAFVVGLSRILKTREPNFVLDAVGRIKEQGVPFYGTQHFFAELVDLDNVEEYITRMRSIGESRTAFSVILELNRSGCEAAEQILEVAKELLQEEYENWEKARTDDPAPAPERHEELLRQFRILLEPDKGTFIAGVFDFFVTHEDELMRVMSEAERARLHDLVTQEALRQDPGQCGVTITKEDEGGSRTFMTSQGVPMFRAGLTAARILGIDVTPFRQHVINFIPFAFDKDLETIFDVLEDLSPQEVRSISEVYRNRDSDLWRHRPESFIDSVQQFHCVEAVPVLREFVRESRYELYLREKALTSAESLASNPNFLTDFFQAHEASKGDDGILAETANGLLVSVHADSDAIKWRLAQVKARVTSFVRPEGPGVHSVSPLEAELTGRGSFSTPLTALTQPGFEEEYLSLLDDAVETWAKGREFHAYSEYLSGIAFAYIDNLKQTGSYRPLRLLQDKMHGLKNRDGANWLAGRMVRLRRSYLAYLGKPENIADAVYRYNEARLQDNKQILNSDDLFSHLQQAIESDLVRWIEGEGAYALILTGKVYKQKKQEYEKLIQKTLKTQIENILLKRGFQVDVLREPELLDSKRTDFLVRYGFAGPIVLEVKLTSNRDIQRRKIEESPSYDSMRRYMDGYGAPHGVFLVIDNQGLRNLDNVRRTFEQIPNVWCKVIPCYSKEYKAAVLGGNKAPKNTATSKKTSSKTASKKATKALSKEGARKQSTVKSKPVGAGKKANNKK